MSEVNKFLIIVISHHEYDVKPDYNPFEITESMLTGVTIICVPGVFLQFLCVRNAPVAIGT